MRKVLLYVAVVVSVLAGLLGLFVGVMNIFTHWCGDDCGSTASRVTWGVIQFVAGLLLVIGAYLAGRLHYQATVVWLIAMVASIVAYFWAWQILLPVLIIIGLGVWAVYSLRRR